MFQQMGFGVTVALLVATLIPGRHPDPHRHPAQLRPACSAGLSWYLRWLGWLSRLDADSPTR